MTSRKAAIELPPRRDYKETHQVSEGTLCQQVPGTTLKLPPDWAGLQAQPLLERHGSGLAVLRRGWQGGRDIQEITLMVVKSHVHKSVTPGAPSCSPHGENPLPAVATSSLPHRPKLCLRPASLGARGHRDPPGLTLPLQRRATAGLHGEPPGRTLGMPPARMGGQSLWGLHGPAEPDTPKNCTPNMQCSAIHTPTPSSAHTETPQGQQTHSASQGTRYGFGTSTYH